MQSTIPLYFLQNLSKLIRKQSRQTDRCDMAQEFYVSPNVINFLLLCDGGQGNGLILQARPNQVLFRIHIWLCKGPFFIQTDVVVGVSPYMHVT